MDMNSNVGIRETFKNTIGVLHLPHVNDVYVSNHKGQLVTSFITANSS